MSEYVDVRLQHSANCFRCGEYDGYDITGVKWKRCFGCDVFAHEPLKFGRGGYLGSLSKWPDLEHTPYGHESDLLDFPSTYSADYTFHRSAPERLPILKAPVPLAFNPAEKVDKDDSKDHEGVSFHEVWCDPVARTIWLGYKPFMLTNQYFRGYCVGHANWLRKKPDILLAERVSFYFDDGFGNYGWAGAIGAQLTPYLIHALDTEGLWPYLRLSQGSALQWRYCAERKAA